MDYIFTNVKNDPFVIGGILHPDKNHGEYYRLDASKKDIYSGANSGLAHQTSGGTLSVRMAERPASGEASVLK